MGFGAKYCILTANGVEYQANKGNHYLQDCCVIEDNTVLAPETVVPTFARYAGSPAKRVADLPENTQEIMIDFTKSYYNHFLPAQPSRQQ